MRNSFTDTKSVKRLRTNVKKTDYEYYTPCGGTNQSLGTGPGQTVPLRKNIPVFEVPFEYPGDYRNQNLL